MTTPDECYMYLAVGSMINPTSLSLRGIKPLQSWPCKAVDHIRRFWGKGGMAEIFPEKGGYFHSVIHKLSAADMKKLDDIEQMYYRIEVECKLYDGTSVMASAYHFDKSKLRCNVANPPSERYVDIIVQGLEHYGCDPAEIASVRATPNQTPRKKPEEFHEIPVSDEARSRKLTWEEVISMGDGLDGRDLLQVYNGKVLKFVAPEGVEDIVVKKRRQRELVHAATDRTIMVTSYIYEPKYPIVKSVEDMSPEQRAWAEDMITQYLFSDPVYFECVGVVDPYLPVRDRTWKQTQE